MNLRVVLTITLVNFSLLIGHGVPRAEAHTGRRFKIEVKNNQLVAQGYISDNTNDGGGSTRPYVNAIHDHWSNISPAVAHTALPSFDIPAPGPLETFDVNLTLLGIQKWAPPAFAPCTGMTIADCANIPTSPAVLQPLAGEGAAVTVGGVSFDANTLGTATLTTDVMSAGAFDLDVNYGIGSNPANDIFVFEWQLSTDAPGIADSDSVFAIISPDGGTPVERHHHASLFLEEQLSGFNVVPEPASQQLAIVTLLALAWMFRGKLSRAGA